MHSAQSTGIVGSAHCINRERTTKGQPTCRKGYLELQPMEMTLISLIPSTWVLFCQLRAMHLMERHREKLIHNNITFHFLHKSESQSHQRMLLVQKELTYAPIKFHFISNHIYICHTKKLNLIVNTHIKQLLTLNAFWIQLKWIAQLHSRDDKKNSTWSFLKKMGQQPNVTVHYHPYSSISRICTIFCRVSSTSS